MGHVIVWPRFLKSFPYLSLRTLGFLHHVKKSFIFSIRGKDGNGRPKIVGEREVEIPAEFQLQASDVNEHARRAILDQVGQKSYLDLCLETIEITRSKACSDWWKQFPECYWPIKKATISKWRGSRNSHGTVYTMGSHHKGKKLVGPKLSERV